MTGIVTQENKFILLTCWGVLACLSTLWVTSRKFIWGKATHLYISSFKVFFFRGGWELKALWEETLLALFLLRRWPLLLTSFLLLLQIAEATVYFWYVQKACAILNSCRTAISWTRVFRALGLLLYDWILQIKFAVLSGISLGRCFFFRTAPGF